MEKVRLNIKTLLAQVRRGKAKLRLCHVLIGCLLMCLAFLLICKNYEGNRVPIDISVYKTLTSEQSIRGRITPLHVVLTCSTFKAKHDPSLYGALTAAKEKHTAVVGCDAPQDGTSVYPWWALPSSKARKENPYLLVHAIPTVDTDRRVMRDAQRDTFLRYKGAATRRNGFRDEILFLYILSAHYITTESLQVTNYRDATEISGGDESLRTVTPPTELRASRFAVKESLKHLDVLWVINYTQPNGNVTSGVSGSYSFWRSDVHVGLSRVVLTYLLYASYQFPDVPFIGKGDDDAFYKVPQLLIELETMQAEMDTFNRQSKHYTISGVYYGKIRRDGTYSFTPGFYAVLSNSFLSTLHVIPEVIDYAAIAEGSLEIQRMMTLALDPYTTKRAPDYTQYQLTAEDTAVGRLVELSGRYMREQSLHHHKEKVDLVYYRIDSPCRVHDILLYEFNANPHRRNSIAIHIRRTPITLYQLFLYMSNPAGLFNRSDSATVKFIQELRWDEDDVYDHINFAALEQSPLWQELFPSDPARRDAALDNGDRWWDDTHITRLPFTLGVSPNTTDLSISAKVSSKFDRKLLNITPPDGDHAVNVVGLPQHHLCCRRHKDSKTEQTN
ncbi:hypothetical protein, conserved [Angomonas deanei]|uniref:Galactosyltransferase n=1 Tax=Angomonas deanei TaxID=59799 RepID=A0A7G2CIW5_9TRYP|nr:hypothetical protein, conserved [Angomonas deanei]